MLNKNREAEIANALEFKGATQPCPRCRNREFEIYAEAEAPLVANRLDRLSESFSTPLPIILTACKNCGYLAQHVRSLLGVIG
jgi:predicted nucleic-acid-binding Zn-ribbon protein